MAARSRIARSVRVEGRVQGVFYRESARIEAADARVVGWIRNEPDGSVLAHVEGDPDAVARMLDWMAEGPPQARVDAIAVAEATPCDADAFEVLR